jgi:hypothetical protein
VLFARALPRPVAVCSTGGGVPCRVVVTSRRQCADTRRPRPATLQPPVARTSGKSFYTTLVIRGFDAVTTALARRGGRRCRPRLPLLLDLVRQLRDLLVLPRREVVGEAAPPLSVAFDGSRRLCQPEEGGRESQRRCQTDGEQPRPAPLLRLGQILDPNKRLECFGAAYGNMPQATPRLGEFIDKTYMAWAKTNKKSWPDDELICRAIKAHFKGKRLAEISPLDVECFKKVRRETPTRHDERKARSVAALASKPKARKVITIWSQQQKRQAG